MSTARARSRPPTGRPPGRGRVLAAWLGGAAAALQLAAATVRADETVMIHVRGRSQLRLSEGERKTEDGDRFQLVVHVRLDDGNEPAGTGEGASDPGPDADPARSFAGQRVQLRLRGPEGELPPHSALTGPDGRAAFPLSDLATGSYTVVADYAGDDLRDPAHADLSVDLGRQAVTLSLVLPPQAARSSELPVEVRLQSEGRPLSAEVRLTVGELHYPVRVVDGVGRQPVRLRGLPWLRHTLAVLASYPGDKLHSSALQQREVLITTQAQVTLELAAPAPAVGPGGVAELAQGSPLTAVGVVRDEDGPLPDEPVDLEASEQPGGEHPDPGTATASRRALASGVSDSQGRFRIVIPRLPLRPGPAVLAAQVTPRHHYILPARAAELPLTVLPPEPVSALYYVLPLLATALGALLGLFMRWLRPALVRWLAARRARRAPATASTAASATAPELPLGEPGVSLSQGRRLAGLTLRRTVDQTLDGQVVDASFGRPVSGAVLSVQPTAAKSDPARTLDATEDGRFAVEHLPAGRYLVVVTAPGYLSQGFPATIPHRGELRGVSIRLLPIRVRLLDQWRRVAQRLLGQEAQLRTATPRELLEQFGRLRSATAVAYAPRARELRHLTELVEQAYYSPRVCTPEMLAEAARLADALLAGGPTEVPVASASRPPPGPPVPLS